MYVFILISIKFHFQKFQSYRGASTQLAWRARNASPSAQPHNLSVAKSTSLASFDENERRSMERKISDLELQLKVRNRACCFFFGKNRFFVTCKV